MDRRPAPTLLLLAGAAGSGLSLLTELARALGHQIAPAGTAASRLGGWFGTGERVAVAETRLAEQLDGYAAAADSLGAAMPVLVLVDHPALTATDTPGTTAWLDAVLGAAQATRGRPRALLRLDDLLEDWRAVLSRADKESGSRLIASATLAQLDDADDVVTGWPAPPSATGQSATGQPDVGRLDVEPSLRDLAARAAAALDSVAEGGGDLDFVEALWAEYAAEYGAAS